MNITELREAICLAFRGKPVSRVDLFGSAARGKMTPESDVDILVKTRSDPSRPLHHGGGRGGGGGPSC
jgi:predicted nucleotidyltransferase